MENKYYTPKIDTLLKNYGWKRIEGNPVYIKEVDEGQFKWKVFFSVDFEGYQGFYEHRYDDFINHSIISNNTTYKTPEEHIYHALQSGGSVTYISDENFKYALIADFYSHNKDKKQFKRYKELYESLTGKQY